ncbi:unnamed protein product [Trichobilharzia szidati]|nr:unnamed protein product [Trichobilharzia szidati]
MTVNKEVLKNCPNTTNFGLVSFEYLTDVCSVRYRFAPNEDEVMKHEECRKTVNHLIENAHTMTWGEQWKCKQHNYTIPVTSYYSFNVTIEEVEVVELEKAVDAKCILPMISLNRSLRAYWMNYFGGYQWEIDSVEQCSEPFLDPPDLKILPKLRKNKIFCSVVIFILYGHLKTANYDNIFKRISNVVTHLQSTCSHVEAYEFQKIRSNYLALIDMLIDRTIEAGNYGYPQYDIIAVLWGIMRHFSRSIANYYGNYLYAQEESERLRGSVVFAHPKKPNHTVHCGDDITVEVHKPNSSNVVLVCTKNSTGIGVNNLELASKPVFVQIAFTKETILKLKFNIVKSPTFAHYICIYLSPESRGYIDEKDTCPMEEGEQSKMKFIGKKSGLYALVKITTELDTSRAYNANNLANGSVSLCHLIVICQLFLAAIPIASILWTNCGTKFYYEREDM